MKTLSLSLLHKITITSNRRYSRCSVLLYFIYLLSVFLRRCSVCVFCMWCGQGKNSVRSGRSESAISALQVVVAANDDVCVLHVLNRVLREGKEI